jgi:hypothetical protein
MANVNSNGILWITDSEGNEIAAKAVVILNDNFTTQNSNTIDTSNLATEVTLSALNNKTPSGLNVVDGRLLVATATDPNDVQTITGEVSQLGTWNINLPLDAATETTLNTKIPSNLTVTNGRLLVETSVNSTAATEATLLTTSNRLMPTTGTTEVNYLGTSVGTTIKASSGHVYNLYCCNLLESTDSSFSEINAATRYLQLFNSASGFNNLIKSYTVYPNNGVLILGQDFFGGEGLFFNNGITWGISSTPLVYTPIIAAEQVIVNIKYK